MSDAIHWTEYLKALGPTLVASVVAYIAFQQWRVNRATLREKLFDRRWQVFKESQAFLSEILREAKYSEESYWKFTDTCQRARFLFKDDISKYLMEIRTRAGQMRMYQKQLEGLPVGQKRSDIVEKENIELAWLADQLVPIFDKFKPYLSFREID
ncbi:MAG: hypothetical protein ACP5DX_02065 [Paracoccaceae bacterium]